MMDIADFEADMKVLDALFAHGYVGPSEYHMRYQELYQRHEFHKYVQDFPWWAPKEVLAKLDQDNSIMPDEIHTPLTDRLAGYLSLTEIARTNGSGTPGYMIQSWMRNKNTVELLHLWETRNNPNYISQGYDELRRRQSQGPFTLTLKHWIT